MNVPNVVASLIEAQNNHDSEKYADCFAYTAIVHDEGKIHTGKAAIRQWIEQSNQQYQSVMKPLSYEETDQQSVLTAEVSGNFPGSPAVLKFHLTTREDLIQSLKITG
ncbi:nuclear transport factor 2 family protein [Pedobacter sp. SYP-B3415]|uniref:nuclear transport factor 2 family protein n=1 Tax=Pedobacter sp. SYP-B3415 TaxID=2496641 RepID=UPI00101BB22A|nr:nuclear transport factor 2 family protein [Pedobacter sp. SYP-B3415]